MSSPLLLLVVAVAAYLIGAIPFGYLVARAKGIDIFKEGSGNLGATNVGRVLGQAYGFLVFGLDLAKGALPVLLAGLIPPPADLYADALPVTAGVAAFLGHLFPVYLGFKGGKGVATAAGVVLVLLPAVTLLLAVVWLATFSATRTVSVASLLVAVLLGVHRLVLPGAWDADHVVVTVFCLLAALLVVVRHAGNLSRIARGKENAFPESPLMSNLARMLHVSSVGLWFGTLVCFTMVGYLLFATLDQLSAREEPDRPYYLKTPDVLTMKPPSEKFPTPLRREQGSLLAGDIVSPMFPWFFAAQFVCGVVAVLTAFAWWRTTTGKVRIVLLLLALALVCFGWIVEAKVSELRDERNRETIQLFNYITLNNKAQEPQLAVVNAARSNFGMWHGISMLANVLTLALVAPAMLLAGVLPGDPPEPRTQRAPAG